MDDLKVPFNAPLKKLDTESQTEGCRANNPNICSSNMITGICAFASNDRICKNHLELGKSNIIFF